MVNTCDLQTLLTQASVVGSGCSEAGNRRDKYCLSISPDQTSDAEKWPPLFFPGDCEGLSFRLG